MKRSLKMGIFSGCLVMIFVLSAACKANKYVCEFASLKESYVSLITGRTIDVYDVMRSDTGITLLYQDTVKLDRKTENVISFSNISPSPDAFLGDISDLREEKILVIYES